MKFRIFANFKRLAKHLSSFFLVGEARDSNLSFTVEGVF